MKFLSAVLLGAVYGYLYITVEVRRRATWPQEMADSFNRLLAKWQVPIEILPSGVEYYTRYAEQVLVTAPAAFFLLLAIQSWRLKKRDVKIKHLRHQFKEDLAEVEEEWEKKLAEAEATHAERMKEEKQAYARLQEHVEDLEKTITEQKEKISSLASHVAELKDEKQELEESLEDFKYPEALQKITLVREEQIAELRGDIKDLNAIAGQLQQKLADEQARAAGDRARADALSERVQEMEALKERNIALENERVALLQQLSTVREELAGAGVREADELGRLRAEADHLVPERTYREALIQVARLETRLELLTRSEEEEGVALQALGELKVRLDSLTQTLAEKGDESKDTSVKDALAEQGVMLAELTKHLGSFQTTTTQALEKLAEQVEAVSASAEEQQRIHEEAVHRNGQGDKSLVSHRSDTDPVEEP